MHFRLSEFKQHSFREFAAGALACALACAVPVHSQDALEFQELQNNLRTAYAKIQALEQLEQAGGTPSLALQQSTAAAQAEAAELKERYQQLRGLLDALDIAAIESGGDEKSQRLISALNDLRLVKEENKRLNSALLSLLEASMEFSQVATPGNPDSVAKLGQAMQLAESTLHSSLSRAGAPPRSSAPPAW